MKNIFNNRFGGIATLWVVFMFISFLTRLCFLIISWSNVDTSLWALIKSFTVGCFFDIVAFGYFMLAFILFPLFMPLKVVEKKWYRWVTYLMYGLAVYFILYLSVAEYFFWEEFNVRFNFIAVDYLIYTTEVVNNIIESYPIVWIFLGVAVLTVGIMLLIKKYGWLDAALQSKQKFPMRLRIFLVLLILPIFSLLFVTHRLTNISNNVYNRELAKNGLYSFIEAYKNNNLDYKLFYPTMEEREAFTNTRRLLQLDNRKYLSDDVLNPVYFVENEGPEKAYNIMFITVESLSGEYLEYMGSAKGKITPFLDSLAKESLLFTNLYSTGTRTVRGLEALSLSVPPTPGTSIVRRPNNNNLYSLGHIFKQKGYVNNFVYGGVGFFDNMNAFFEGNGFNIIDKTVMTKEEISFENAWGTCDQDSYNRAIKEADKAYAEGKYFLNYVLTTSNHRPYTFPEVGLDLPPERASGVRYTDFALQDFFQNAKQKPWFNSTIFVIVADHCAGSAGETELPIKNYQIPCIMYCPSLITPQTLDVQCSQIDVLPTLLAILGISYEGMFFGTNALEITPEESRAFIATYQDLGYIKGDKMLQLTPRKKPRQFSFNHLSGEMVEGAVDEGMKNDAISLYQTAETIFVEGRSKVLKTK